MDTLLQDFRYSLRMLLKKPGFTLLAILTLALGIGANTAIFSFVNAVLLRPLPFPEPERIVALWENNLRDGIERDDVSPANFLDWRDRATMFDEMAFANPWSMEYTGGGEPESFRGTLVSDGFFRILGTQALLGRTFLPEEHQDGRNAVAVLSYGLWQQRFGGKPDVIGQQISLRGQATTIIGVLSPEFKLNLFQDEARIIMPQVMEDSFKQQRRATYLKVIAKLKPGATVEQARAELSAIATRLAEEYPRTNASVGVTTIPLTEQLIGQVRPALWVLFAAVVFVLLIACANVANLLLARSGEREREFAVRAAIGAGRQRLIRQMLMESLLLALCGSLLGLLLAWWGLDVIKALSPDNVPRLELVRLDRVTLGFMLFVSFLTAVVFGLAPAWHFSKPDLNLSLKDTAQSVAGAARNRLRGALVVAEIALALVLLVGAGLLVRSFVSLLKVDPGFASDRLVALQVFVWSRYSTPEKRAAYVKDALEKLHTVPGVIAAGATTALPFLESSQDSSLPIVIEGRPAPPQGQEPTAFYTIATPDYFAAIGTPLLRGRLFSEFDTSDSSRIILINETMAARFWSNEDPVGRKITIRGRDRSQNATNISFEIVGVVKDVRHAGLEVAPRPEYFLPYAQSPSGGLIFTVRTAADPATLLPTLKARIWEVNPAQPFYRIATMDAMIADTLKARRFSLALLGAFALLALVLALVGIYGVMSFLTAQRTREIGVRMALGAQSRDILTLVLRQGMTLTTLGIASGLIASLALTRLMKSLLFGVSATDPLTFVLIAALLATVALLACLIPARRATKTDPMIALRCE